MTSTRKAMSRHQVEVCQIRSQALEIQGGSGDQMRQEMFLLGVASINQSLTRFTF